MAKPITSMAQARASGFKAIKTVRGKLIFMEVVNSRFKKEDGTPSNDQVELRLSPAEILEMDEGTSMVELKDATFTCWYNYAPHGETIAAEASPWVRAFLKSAKEELKVEDVGTLVGTDITLTKKTVVLFPRKVRDAQGNQTSEDVVGEYLVLTKDAGSVVDDPAAFREYVTKKVVGKTPSAALRELAGDNKTRNSEYTVAARNGTLADELGLTLDKKGRLVEA